ncbi:MAG: hypothetical protein M0Z41_22005 [Peptococcaceae bacterium]|nr:hypothetical protein [Peptococcaceae bacterium]
MHGPAENLFLQTNGYGSRLHRYESFGPAVPAAMRVGVASSAASGALPI